jgi:hypothetical protein
VRRALLGNQRLDGRPCSFQGSWDAVDPWGTDGGRVYATALGALMLSVYNRYERIAAPK